MRIPAMTDMSFSGDDLAPIVARLRPINADLARRYPGESGARQPVHTVYGGAQLFAADTVAKVSTAGRIQPRSSTSWRRRPARRRNGSS